MSASQRRFGAETVKASINQVDGSVSVFVGDCRATFLGPLTTPLRPSRRIRRSTVYRATPIPSHRSWRHTFLPGALHPAIVGMDTAHAPHLVQRPGAKRAEHRPGSRWRRWCSQDGWKGRKGNSAQIGSTP